MHVEFRGESWLLDTNRNSFLEKQGSVQAGISYKNSQNNSHYSATVATSKILMFGANVDLPPIRLGLNHSNTEIMLKLIYNQVLEPLLVFHLFLRYLMDGTLEAEAVIIAV